METILEQQRRYHEERERIMEEMVKEKLHKKGSHKEQINSEHRLRQLLDRSVEVAGFLEDLYDDQDGIRKAEVNALSGPNEFAEFYSRLKAIKEFHKKHPNEISVPMSVEFQKFAEARESHSEEYANFVEFSAEEGYGKFLDLHECYNKYINLKGIERVDYITYLTIFDHLFDIPKDKKNQEYKKYLQMLLDYLADFLSRIRPLLDIDYELKQADEEFSKVWESGNFPGWPKETTSAMAHTGAHLDLSAFSSWEELASLGLDRLKSALMALGLKCGGTLEERAKRLFSTKGKMLDELDPSIFAKKASGAAALSKKSTDSSERNREIARHEAGVYKLAEYLMEQKKSTKENVQRKQARTHGEEEDEEEDVAEESDDDDNDDDIPYNPKNLPLGWDGKPIPYWLYKLHGLNIDFQCEICGNYKYRGPKAFQRHFSESWRHAHGMRCLGIPNTAHFANVVSIESAVTLWNKIKNKNESVRWSADTEEEFEDSLGNVINKKIFEDLKRQGLL